MNRKSMLLAVALIATITSIALATPPKREPEQADRTIALRPPHHRLLDGAIPVVVLNKRFRDYCWLSPTRVLLVWNDHDFDIYDSNTDNLGSWSGWADVLDLKTGRRTKLHGLTGDLRHAGGLSGEFRLSPGGKWLEWTTVDTGDGWPIPVAARLDGSGFQRFSQDKWSDTGWLDDHTWVEIGARDTVDDTFKDLVVVDDLRRQSRTTLPKSAERASRIAEKVYRTNGGEARLGGTAHWIRFKMSGASTLVIPNSARTAEKKTSIWLSDAMVLGARHAQSMLYGVRIQPGYGKTWLKDSFYISEATGSSAHELGFILPENTGFDGSAESLYQYYFSWLPGDGSISFVYRNRLYVKKVHPLNKKHQYRIR